MASVLDLCIVLHATSRDFMVLIFFYSSTVVDVDKCTSMSYISSCDGFLCTVLALN